MYSSVFVLFTHEVRDQISSDLRLLPVHMKKGLFFFVGVHYPLDPFSCTCNLISVTHIVID